MKTVLFSLLLLLSACGPKCLREGNCRTESYTYFMLVGKVMVPMTGYRTVCDCLQYEDKKK